MNNYSSPTGIRIPRVKQYYWKRGNQPPIGGCDGRLVPSVGAAGLPRTYVQQQPGYVVEVNQLYGQLQGVNGGKNIYESLEIQQDQKQFYSPKMFYAVNRDKLVTGGYLTSAINTVNRDRAVDTAVPSSTRSGIKISLSDVIRASIVVLLLCGIIVLAVFYSQKT